MTPFELRTTQVLRSRLCSLLLVVFALASAYAPMPTVGLGPLAGIDRGLLFASPGHWLPDGPRAFGWALALNLLVMGLMALINRRYNLLRTLSWLFVGIFGVMEAASPETLRAFTGGQFAAFLVMWCVWLMFSTYHKRRRTKRVFMVFCLMSAACMVQYGFVVYLGVFLAGCAQMRIFSFRTLLAAVLGLVTPWWIVFGMGFAVPADLHMPVVANPFRAMDSVESLQLFVPVGVTLLAGLVCGTTNLFKIIGLNARMRALNGLLTVTSIVTGIMAIIDFTNIEFYIPLLNACVAFQIGYFFRNNIQRRAYVPVLLLLCVYIGIWIWKLII